MVNIDIKREDIVLVDFEPVKGSEQGGVRPALIIQNNIYNKYSPTTIVAPMTSKLYSKEYPTNVHLSKLDSNLDKESTILLNQIKTIDKSRIKKRISILAIELMNKVNLAIRTSLDIN